PLRNATINVSSGAQFRTYTSPTINNNITLNGGTGPDGNGALWNESTNSAHTANYTGTITLANATNSTIGNSISGIVISGQVTGGGSLTKTGNGTLTFSGNNSYTGTTTVSAGTLEIGAAGRLGSGNYSQNITNNGSLIYSGTNAQELSGIISGTGALTQNAASTLTLTGNLTYTGATTITAGTLVLKPTSAFNGGNWSASSNTTINSGGRLVIDTTAQTAASSRQAVGNITVNSGGTLELTNTVTSVDYSIWTSGTILGSGTLIKSGAGYQQIAWNSSTGFNNFNGTVLVNAGTLGINNNAIGNGQVDMTVASGASFDIRTGSLIMDSLDGAGTIYTSWSLGTGITLGANNGSGNFSGVIQNPNNTMTLTKNGTGTQTLTGNNTYSGATTISAGTLT
ncbi:hypothetical protein EBU02_14590, partial [bacterium]|nr:hypothetical protein [bacterium]